MLQSSCCLPLHLIRRQSDSPVTKISRTDRDKKQRRQDEVDTSSLQQSGIADCGREHGIARVRLFCCFCRLLPTWSHAIEYLLVAAAAVICFWNSLDGEFVHDDLKAIVNNEDVRSDVTSLYDVMVHDFWGDPIVSERSHKSYRPFTIATFRLNYIIDGLRPTGYHVANVALHASAAILFTYVCRRVAQLDENFEAVSAGVMFAVHPIHSEAVASVVGRADVLAGLLLLLSVTCYYKARSCPNNDVTVNGGQQSYACWLALSLLSSVIATLAKETGITAFGVCLLYDMSDIWWRWFRMRERDGVPNSSFSRQRFPFSRLSVTSFTTFVVILFRLNVMDWTLPRFTAEDNPAAFQPETTLRILSYANVFSKNLWLMVNPEKLSYDWQMGSVPLITSVMDIQNISSFAVLVISGAVISRVYFTHSYRELNALFFGLVLMILPLIMSSNVFFTVGFVIAERVLYIPSMGLIILISVGVRKLNACTRHRFRSTVSVLLVGLIVTHACRTIIRNNVWHDRATLFKSGLYSSPNNAKMHYNYANVLADERRTPLAIEHYRRAIQLWPSYASALNNLGVALNDSIQSEYYYRRAIFHQQCHANAHFNLGNVLRSQQRYTEAIESLRRALQCDAFSSQSHSSLAAIYRTLNKTSAANEHYQAAVRLSPDRPHVYINYAGFLYQNGDFDRAASMYKTSMELLKQTRGQADQTAVHSSASVFNDGLSSYPHRLPPSLTSAQILLAAGQLNEESGHIDNATELYINAVRLEPTVVGSWLRLVNTLRNQLNDDDVIMPLMKLFSESNSRLEVTIQVCNFYGSIGHHSKAISLLSGCLRNKMFANNTQLGLVHLQLAKHFHDSGRSIEAVKHCSMAVQLKPDLSEGHHRLAIYQHLLGNLESARQHYVTALRLNPTDRLIQSNLDRLEKTIEQNKLKRPLAECGGGGNPDINCPKSTVAYRPPHQHPMTSHINQPNSSRRATIADEQTIVKHDVNRLRTNVIT